jgi:hypothetical protein
MRMTIDRIEEGIAVLISRDDPAVRVPVPVTLLPPGSMEGDSIRVSLERDGEATAAARDRVSLLLEKLKKKHQE